MCNDKMSSVRRNIETWLQALEHGNFPQGHGQLSNIVKGNKYYCALGVANEVCKLNEFVRTHLMYTYREMGLRSCFSQLKKPVQINGVVYNYLSTINDTSGLTFPQISRWIRFNYTEVFDDAVCDYLKQFPVESTMEFNQLLPLTKFYYEDELYLRVDINICMGTNLQNGYYRYFHPNDKVKIVMG